MQSVFTEIIQRIFDPTIGTETLFTLVALGALVVAGMSTYATMLAVKALSRKR